MYDEVHNFPIREPIYAVKRPCPRNLGLWYCDECKAKNLEDSSNIEYPLEMWSYCGNREFEDGKICGKTHLGYEWCKECQAKGTFEPDPHINQFEIIGYIGSESIIECEGDENVR